MVDAFFNLGLVCLAITTCRYLVFRMGGMPLLAITGPIGVVIHELSHYLMCKLMGFQVAEVVLFKIPKSSDPTCGYVNYYRPVRSITAPVRALLVSIAPLFGGALSILLVTPLILGAETSDLMATLLRERFQSAQVVSLTQYASFYRESWGYLMNHKNLFELALWVYLCASIAIHALPSKPDLQQARMGSLYITAIVTFLMTYGLLWVCAWALPSMIKVIASITYGLAVGVVPLVVLVFLAATTKLIRKKFQKRSVVPNE